LQFVQDQAVQHLPSQGVAGRSLVLRAQQLPVDHFGFRA